MVLGYISSHCSRFLVYCSPPNLGPDSSLVYCPSGWSATRDNIAAWPAAVAASRDLFLSASVRRSVRARDAAPFDTHRPLFPAQSLGRSPRSQGVPGSRNAMSRAWPRTWIMNTDRDLVVPVQHTYLNIFGTSLDHLEQTFDRQLD